MLKLTPNKKLALEKLSNSQGKIAALAIDQRGALKKMMGALNFEASQKNIEEFKVLVSQELTPFSSSILLDPEYGIPASQVRDKNCGLMMAYEKTGYDATIKGRLPDILDNFSVHRLKELGCDAVKFLLYYDVDEDSKINEIKHIAMERIGNECAGADLPFFLELLSYDCTNSENGSIEYAKVKPKKVIEMMKEFSKQQYKVDVLKVEVPINMDFVEGYAKGEVLYTFEQAKEFFKEQSDATHLPFIFLSAGVSASLFRETLLLAAESSSQFNGVLCGRATWRNAVEPFSSQGKEATIKWLKTEGKNNMEELNKVINETAQDWHKKISH